MPWHKRASDVANVASVGLPSHNAAPRVVPERLRPARATSALAVGTQKRPHDASVLAELALTYVRRPEAGSAVAINAST